MRRAWLWLIGLVLVAGGAGVLLWTPTGGNASDQAYRLAAVDRGPITASVRATGTLNPVTTVLVGSQLSGQVVEILADYNTPVKEGQVVARLYSEQIKSRRDAALADLAQAKADLDTKRAQIDKARSSLQRGGAQATDLQAQRDRSQAQLVDAQRNLERQTELTTRAVGTQNALEQARHAGRYPEGEPRLGQCTDRVEQGRDRRPQGGHRPRRGQRQIGRGDHPAAPGKAQGHRDRSRPHRHQVSRRRRRGEARHRARPDGCRLALRTDPLHHRAGPA